MNKLREWLKKIAGAEAPRMGFGAPASKAKGPSMGLLVALSSIDKKMAGLAVEAGAEALVVRAGLASDAEALRALIQDFRQCLWGVQLDGGQAPEGNLGFDFTILSTSSTLSALKGEEQGRLLAVDPSWDDVQLRVLEQLPVDGAVFSLRLKEETRPAVEHLITVRRLSLLLRKPLFLELGRSLPAEDLEQLRDGGLSGLLVPAGAAGWPDVIKELRQNIEALPPRGKPRRELDAILPSIPGGRPPKPDEEEEDE